MSKNLDTYLMIQTKNKNEMPLSKILQWYQDMGIDEAICENPIDRFNLPKEKSIPKQTNSNKKSDFQTNPIENVTPAQSPNENILKAKEAVLNVKSLKDLQVAIEKFDGLPCIKTAHSTIFGDGNPNSDLMIITDTPNADEDREGKPMVGEVGNLFEKMMEAIGQNREKDFYIASLLPWRILGNRKPNENEIAACLPFLRKHIELVNPKILVLFGTIPSQALLKNNKAINQMRGKWQTLEINNSKIETMPTLHPSYLIRQPNAKRDSWHDLLEIKKKIKAI